ncbi:MAG TPA: hypothetical protein VKI99_02440 [Candidatus Dormibacteraeota bacterium]|nr:hypothetical protein [Candidatus Dormibacteraeota bacterium]
MPGRPPPYQPDDLRTNITHAAERLPARGEGGQDDQPASDSPARPEPAPDSRPLSDADALEVEAVRRRRLLDAFLHGASRPAARSGTGRGLLIGIAVAIAIALCVGLVAMVQATMAHGGSGRPGSGVVTVRTAI